MFFTSGSRTPHYGGQTPQHDGSRTPRGMSSAWDANNPNTPSPHTDFDYEQSPNAFNRATTPNVNTPNYADQQSPADAFVNPGTPSAHSNVNSPFAVTPSPQSYDGLSNTFFKKFIMCFKKILSRKIFIKNRVRRPQNKFESLKNHSIVLLF